MSYFEKIAVDKVLRKLDEKEDELKDQAYISDDQTRYKILETLAVGLVLRVLLRHLVKSGWQLSVRAVKKNYKPRFSWITGARIEMR